eukprot:5215891-Pyramimonas_sp.AAC.1
MGAKDNESCSRAELTFLFQVFELSVEEEHDVRDAVGVATANINTEVNYCRGELSWRWSLRALPNHAVEPQPVGRGS